MIIDFHTHIFPPCVRKHRERYLKRDATFSELYSDPAIRMATAEDLIEAMYEDGVDHSVVMGIGWVDPGLAREVNDYIIESTQRYPRRLVGFGGINPVWKDKAVREAERCAQSGLRGIGELHPSSQAFDLGEMRTMASMVEVLKEHKLILTIHSSEPVGHVYSGKGKTRPEVLWRFIQNFPDLTVVFAHWGGGLPFYSLMPEVAKGLANVYFDTAASPFLYTSKIFSTISELAGSDRILMGSDFPLLRVGRIQKQISQSGLSETDTAAIIGNNAAKLLSIQYDV